MRESVLGSMGVGCWVACAVSGLLLSESLEASEVRAAYGNGVFVQSTGFVSTNGLDWRQVVPIKEDVYVYATISFGGGNFLIYGGGLWVSGDGLSWDQGWAGTSLGVPFYWRGFFWAPSSGRMWNSANGCWWQSTSCMGIGGVRAVGRGLVLSSIVDSTNDVERLYLSSDLRVWTEVPDVVLPLDPRFAYGAGRFTVVYWRPDPEGKPRAMSRFSEDGLHWSDENEIGEFVPRSVLYANKAFMIASSAQALFSSPDGVTWASQALPSSEPQILGAVWGGGRLVVFGRSSNYVSGVTAPAVTEVRLVPRLCGRLADGAMWLTIEGPYGHPVRVEASTNLVDWVPVAGDPNDRGEFEVYDDGAKGLEARFYRAVEGEYKAPPPDPFLAWARAPEGLEGSIYESGRWRLAYGNGVHVAVADNRAYASADGRSWTRTSTSSHRDVAFGHGRFVTVNPPFTSTNGVEWTMHAVLPVSSFVLAFGRGKFRTWGWDLPGVSPKRAWAFISLDGASWDAHASIGFEQMTSASFGRGRLVGSTGGQLLGSADGVVWQPCYRAPDGDFSHPVSISGLAYGGGRFVAAGVNGWAANHVLLLTSQDGVEWIDRSGAALGPRTGLIYANGLFLGLGGMVPGHPVIVTSVDGESWVERGPFPVAGDVGATFGNGRFILASEWGYVYRSGVIPPHVEQPRIVEAASLRLEDGAMLVTVEGPYGKEVVVESSEDIVNWAEIARDPCDRGEFEVYDEAAKDGKQRFYRARPATQ